MKKNKIRILLLFVIFCVATVVIYRYLGVGQKQQDVEKSELKEDTVVGNDLVNVKVNPSFRYKYSIMKVGVKQHIDRHYTYDIVPDELLNGLLFQGIHRPPTGTSIEIDLYEPATIYFFFHQNSDGGYSEIFEKLENWERCSSYPQYDIKSGSKHGLDMIMYKIKAEKGNYLIPPTTKDRACFNIVFQPQGNE